MATLEKFLVWQIGDDPTQMSMPLRTPASVMSGCVAVCATKLDGAERSERFADFLMWTQEQAGAGLFPFPAARNTSKARAMEVATRFLDRAEKAGRLAEIIRHGWAFDDLGDGGLQFDNGGWAQVGTKS